MVAELFVKRFYIKLRGGSWGHEPWLSEINFLVMEYSF